MREPLSVRRPDPRKSAGGGADVSAIERCPIGSAVTGFSKRFRTSARSAAVFCAVLPGFCKPRNALAANGESAADIERSDLMRILIFAPVLAAVALYLYFFFLRALAFWLPRVRKNRLRAAASVAALALAACCADIFSTVTLAALHIVAAGLAADLLHLLAVLVQKAVKRKLAAADALWRCGLVPLAAVVLLFGYGYWNMRDIRAAVYTVETAKSLRPEGYRVALITDLHFGNALSLDGLKQRGAEISAAKPDLVVLGGDIVDEGTELAEMQAAISALGAIESEFGVYYVFGNHDRAPYTASPHFTEAELLAALADSGVTVLDDETVLLNGELWLAGRADAGHGAERKATAALLEGADADDFILLIDHQPVGFEENIAAGVDLQLSGHTHNGQIWPVAHIIELFRTADLVYGHRQTGEFHAVVSSGIVGWGYPIRTQGHSEYVVVEIRPQA